eukprot:IDg22326t1
MSRRVRVLRRDYAADAAGGTRKLAPTADVFFVRDLTGTTAVIQLTNQLEAVSLNQVVLAPTPAQSIQGDPVKDIGDTDEYTQIKEEITPSQLKVDVLATEQEPRTTPNDSGHLRRLDDEGGARIMVVKN